MFQQHSPNFRAEKSAGQMFQRTWWRMRSNTDLEHIIVVSNEREFAVRVGEVLAVVQLVSLRVDYLHEEEELTLFLRR